jgi:GMP synthase-like glutamine amidotransferase
VFDIFDLRQKGEIPSISYDIFISSGGPGDPFEGEGEKWDNDFCNLLDEIDRYNKINQDKKYAFLICHSFQLACRKYNIGKVTQRKSTAFGIFPIVATGAGETDQIFAGLPNPFYAVENRKWQVTSIDGEESVNTDATTVLAIEKERPHVDLQRCLMAVRFSDEVVGTQFHPEADPEGMKMYLLGEEKRKTIIGSQGELKYNNMLASLDNPQRIRLTQQVILPNFLNQAINALQEA